MRARRSVLVVGAGAGGLVAASYLLRQGFDVLVLEAKEHVGGCASAFATRGFRFLAGATTLIGLEEDMPLGIVLRELGVSCPAAVAEKNLTVRHGDVDLTLTRQGGANVEALSRRYGASFGRFWAEAAALGARAWGSVTRLPLPPRDVAELLRSAASKDAWRMLPALLRSTGSALRGFGPPSPDAQALLDELLLVSTQADSRSTPFLFGALGVEYLQRRFFLAEGGLAGLLERLAADFQARGGKLLRKTPVERLERAGRGWRAVAGGQSFEAEAAVLNLTHWDAAKLVTEPSLRARFERAAVRHPDAWSACALYLGARDVFAADAAPYYQLVLERPLPVSGARSLFVTLQPKDGASAPEGFRAVTVSCHVHAERWFRLSDAEHAEAKAKVAEEMVGALEAAFPGLRGAEKPVVSVATPKTWQSFTGRSLGRVGGLPFTFATLRRGYPTGRTSEPTLVRVGDTTLPGQSVLAVAWGARRTALELARVLSGRGASAP
ncbi:MAG TPA: FAD-dependent oxidoreductase [Myxococcaceae bacterium]|nr:FAD-dependent oxidoreductase [Myxococcaceae bacterium]